MKVKRLMDDLWDLVGSPYMSDLRYSPWRQAAQRYISELEESVYSLGEWNDTAYYLSGKNIQFTDAAAAKRYLLNVQSDEAEKL
ncbi:hypothetical protein MCG44_00245 [Lawsonibacter sp. OA9]|uniref:hypothetical protein n=1 Tax=Oscillospiraceae TaxID=216572 RepID=UPI001F05DA11|nr:MULTISPECIES: hypothetical protein [Oscillospiraceae]MCH1978185.1 hypothetical protein [Lawsonibacter sp. OA9]MCH1981183.1 hypothetical protein [Ruminococcus sp. OA3]